MDIFAGNEVMAAGACPVIIVGAFVIDPSARTFRLLRADQIVRLAIEPGVDNHRIRMLCRRGRSKLRTGNQGLCEIDIEGLLELHIQSVGGNIKPVKIGFSTLQLFVAVSVIGLNEGTVRGRAVEYIKGNIQSVDLCGRLVDEFSFLEVSHGDGGIGNGHVGFNVEMGDHIAAFNVPGVIPGMGLDAPCRDAVDPDLKGVFQGRLMLAVDIEHQGIADILQPSGFLYLFAVFIFIVENRAVAQGIFGVLKLKAKIFDRDICAPVGSSDDNGGAFV